MQRKSMRIRLPRLLKTRWFWYTTVAVGVPLAILCGVAGYYYISFARLVDARLHGERDTVLPRVLGRPLELYKDQSLTEIELIDRLNDLGYAQRVKAEQPGEFAVADATITIAPRPAALAGQRVQVLFRKPVPPKRTGRAASPPPPPRAPDRVDRILVGSQTADRLALDAPVFTSLIGSEREKRRPVALPAIPPHMVQAVLAIEDRRFYDHPGVDLIGVGGAAFAYLTGRRAYMAGGSTITQQLVRNVFLPKFQGMTLQTARERSVRRKILEIFVSIVITQRASKDEILEMYLNDIPLGQRGSFAIFGVAEASRLFFGKDVSNISLAEAATIAGVIQSPSALSPFSNATRCRDRRNVVLQAMAEAGYASPEEVDAAGRGPLGIAQRALEAEAPHFVDFVGQTLADEYAGLTTTTNEPVDVHTTLDVHLQRLAQDAIHNGLAKVDDLLAKRKRKGRAEAALLAVDPRTGDILSLVGGRNYMQSQYNRAVTSRRQPGSVFKPFVYLTAFEEAAAEGRTDVTPASIALDEQETFVFDDQVWTPENYQDEYGGPITFRQALAHSRNLATIHVAQSAGYDRVAALWGKLGVGNPPKAYPSIALGVFEATPLDIATAYTLFPNGGAIRPLRHIMRITVGDKDVTKPTLPTRRVTRPDTTYLVTNMMESVVNAGTAASVRSNGFKLQAAGKTGTTNDLRDAWFVGFTPELLTVVWVGFDDNQPVGLSGSQAALPIWTEFMTRALAGHVSQPFEVPEGVSFVDVDAESGKLAMPACPKVIREVFLTGTEPVQACDFHRF